MNHLYDLISKHAPSDSIREINDTFTDTGCIAANLLLSGKIDGGIPNSGITMLGGESGFGKTFLALSAARSFLLQGYTVLWIDTEFALNEDILESFGINKYIEQHQFVIIGETSIPTIKSILLPILTDAEKDSKLGIFIDSYAGLTTNRSIEDGIKGKETVDMYTTKEKNHFISLVNGIAAKKRIPVVLNNHVYDEIGAFIPTKVLSGGSKAKYFSNSVLMLNSKAKLKDPKNIIIGNIITASTLKSRFAKENSKLKFYINYKNGLNKYYGLLDLFVELELIQKKGKKYFSISNPDKLYWEKELYTPEVFDDLLKMHKFKIEAFFQYQSSDVEEMILEDEKED
jgi:RecA/RadA recombinase